MKLLRPILLGLGLCAGCDEAPEPRLASEGSMLEFRQALDLGQTAAGALGEEALFGREGSGPGVLSVTVLAESLSERAAPGMSGRFALGVRDDTQRLLVDPLRSESSANRVLSGRRVVVGQLPSASASIPLSPAFSVTARWLQAEPLDPSVTLRVFIKRGLNDAVVPKTQELALRFVTVGNAKVNDTRLSGALFVARRIWRTAGIEIVDAGRTVMDGAEAQRWNRVTVDSALGSDSPAVAALLRLSARLPAPPAGHPAPLSVFLVAGLEVSGQAPIWATSGGIPVPPVLGTSRSGMIVHAELLALSPERAGQIVAHEIGHALGLYHSTEGRIAGGPVHDQLSDTPECAADADVAPADGSLSATECAAFGGNNLMFWAGSSDATTLTIGQGEMVRRSALVR